MKKFLFVIVLASLAGVMNANLTVNGYYRVKNYGSSRWASLVDNKGKVDFIAGTADLHAISLTKDTQEILSDPGSIVYVTSLGGKQYNVAAQGTNLEALVDNPVYVGQSGSADGQDLYYIWGTYKDITKYISDGQTLLSENIGKATINDISNANFRKWMFLPVDVNSDNYFGATPSVSAPDGLYCTLYTSFPYAPYSQGVKAYYIGRVGFGMAEMIEITGGVPASTPVVIKCAGNNVAENKLQIQSAQSTLPSNALKGVYFDYQYLSTTNHVAYNPKTMRVLGLTSDGSLGFVTSNIEYIPANTAYILVPEGAPAEFKCVSTQEFNSNIPLIPDQIYFGDSNILQKQEDYVYRGYFNFPASQNLSFLFYTSESNHASDRIGADASRNVDINLSSPYYHFVYGSPYSWVINNWNGGSITVELNLQYEVVNFFTSAGILDVTTSTVPLRISGKTIYAESNSGIQVYDTAGRIVASTHDDSLNVSHLTSGIYIVVSGQNTIKIAL